VLPYNSFLVAVGKTSIQTAAPETTAAGGEWQLPKMKGSLQDVWRLSLAARLWLHQQHHFPTQCGGSLFYEDMN